MAAPMHMVDLMPTMEPDDGAELAAENYLKFYDSARGRFWRLLGKDEPALAKKFFVDHGSTIDGSTAAYLDISGVHAQEISLGLDHMLPKATGDNFAHAASTPNTSIPDAGGQHRTQPPGAGQPVAPPLTAANATVTRRQRSAFGMTAAQQARRGSAHGPSLGPDSPHGAQRSCRCSLCRCASQRAVVIGRVPWL